MGIRWTIWARAHCSKVLRSEDQFHCGISNASTTNICASTSRISCSIELAEEDDPCKSWYTLCRTVTDTFMTASGDNEVKSWFTFIARFELTILLVVFLRYEIDGILDIPVSDPVLV
jgi:hypothetical protein